MDLELLLKAVKGDVSNTCKNNIEYAEICKAYSTGIGLDNRLRQFVRREDDELFAQRVNLTQHIIKPVFKLLMTKTNRVDRSSANNDIWVDIEKNKAEELTNTFWGNQSVKDYIEIRRKELLKTDPNAFIIIEWKDFDENSDHLKAYPFEVTSYDTINYNYKNNVLEYVIVQCDSTYQKDDKVIECKRMDYYGSDYNSYIVQVGPKFEVTNEKTQVIIKVEDERYLYERYITDDNKGHQLGYVPAIQVSHERSLEDEQSKISPLDAIFPFFEKLIKLNSESDLVNCLLALPQMVKYATRCPSMDCNKGQTTAGGKCGSCKGTGIKATAPSSQDAIVVGMPDDKSDFIDLTQLIQYVYPPIEVVNYQNEKIDDLLNKCEYFLHGSTGSNNLTRVKTATESNYQNDGSDDFHRTYANGYSILCNFIVKTIIKLTDQDDKVKYNHFFANDFKILTIEQLYKRLSDVKDLNNPNLVRAINDDIMEKVFSDRPDELQKYFVKERHNPFSGKSEKEVIYLMSNEHVNKSTKVLYANFGKIFDTIEEENGLDFYILNFTKQKEIINKLIDTLTNDIKPTLEI